MKYYLVNVIQNVNKIKCYTDYLVFNSLGFFQYYFPFIMAILSNETQGKPQTIYYMSIPIEWTKACNIEIQYIIGAIISDQTRLSVYGPPWQFRRTVCISPRILFSDGSGFWTLLWVSGLGSVMGNGFKASWTRLFFFKVKL